MADSIRARARALTACAALAPLLAASCGTPPAAPRLPEPLAPPSASVEPSPPPVIGPVAPASASSVPAVPPSPAAPTGSRRPAIGRRYPEAPPGPVPPELACASANDCVISCEDDCCGAPCGCRTAVNRATAERWRATRAQRCEPKPRCEPVGCLRSEAGGAMCLAGRCTASGIGM